MKLIVKKKFRDKDDHVTVYDPETILEVQDKDRAADLVKRGLCAEYKGKKSASVALGDDAAETPDEGAAETSDEGAAETSAEEAADAAGGKRKTKKK